MDTFSMEEEVRDGYRVTAQMKKVWAVQMEMTKRVLDVCSKHGLRIWADGGTLIGCVRHGGYIPWDDDIDLIMPRADYNRLLEIGPSEFNKPFFFQSAFSERAPYLPPHIQVRKDGTTGVTFLQVEDYVARFHLGIFIDIFALDELPDDDGELDDFTEVLHDQKVRMNYWKRSRFATVTTAWCDSLHREMFGYRLTHTFRREWAKFQEIASRYAGTGRQRVANICLFDYKDIIHKKALLKEWYDETVMLPFEDFMLPAPKEYDKVLTTLYGDYMTPVMSPSLHGGFFALDPDHSYKDIMSKVKREQRRAQWNRLLTLLHIRKAVDAAPPEE